MGARWSEFMVPEKPPASDLVLDLPSFQLIRDGIPLKLEKTPMELLTLLVRRRGTLVTREEIIKEIWGAGVHIDVDSGINTAIRKVRQVLEDSSSRPRYVETVVGMGYRFIGPITVIEKSSELSGAKETVRVRRWMAREIGAGLTTISLAALLLLAVAPSRRQSVAASRDSRYRVVVGVTPLRNLSPEPGQEYLSDGLTDEILTQLGELSPERLAVVRLSPSATTPAPDSTEAAKTALQYVLEGSVRRDHERARISVRLMRVSDATTLWTDTFDRQVGDVLALQLEIAQRIGRELQIQVFALKGRAPKSPEVVEAYLRGRFEMSREDKLPDAARVYLERAIELDPSYAPAYAGLADFYRKHAVRDDAGSKSAWRLAAQYAAQALALDSNSSETHAALAQIKLMHDWDWPAARQHAVRALQLNPSSPDAHYAYARYLRIAGKISEALREQEQAATLDPFRTDLKQQLGIARYFARDYQGIVTVSLRTLEENPNNLDAHFDLCTSLGRLQFFEQAATECTKELALEGHADWATAFADIYRKHGLAAANLWRARKQLDETLKKQDQDLWELANAYVAAGKRDETLETLFRGLPSHEPGLLQVRIDPDFDSIRDDPRYAKLVNRIGFPSE